MTKLCRFYLLATHTIHTCIWLAGIARASILYKHIVALEVELYISVFDEIQGLAENGQSI